MIDDVVALHFSYYRIGSVIFKFKRTFMYRPGPSNRLLAFGTYLSHPFMNEIDKIGFYKDSKELNLSYHKKRSSLDHLVITHAPKKKINNLAEEVVAEKKLLMDINTRYPLILLALKDNVQKDVIEHFEMIGYEVLKI
ncbi:hypothetical protein D6777_02660 [Candidatus Woesearchaeota archaeon]|nr:MAG: hypothetical protein D6777_02660 [Candidatus Woesearchaeota archaeon]